MSGEISHKSAITADQHNLRAVLILMSLREHMRFRMAGQRNDPLTQDV